ncbi:histidine kinase [Teredinibacter turnerae]|uniref:histidine kinase n=1 Tax=Teredinibacter turnerae TaxID=2426 RepID=UPI00036455EF|nr:histidine kinase [Teredinibacter turnerae]
MAEINTLIHEARNPLNNISMNAELGKIMAANAEGNTDKLIEIFTRIIGECQTCSQALTDLKNQLDNHNA